jgi:tetratricopeptide (TPR) repeat protein
MPPHTPDRDTPATPSDRPVRGAPLRVAAVAALLVLSIAHRAVAQFNNGNQTTLLNLPRSSPRAVMTQRIGLTDVTIVYHRPQVKGRTIFGDAVPYDRVWRAGANDNTTIEFTDPVTIDGHALPAGRYGVHMIPGRTEWTVIFSKNSTSWGSFSYDQKEDALRLAVKPLPTAFHEALTYEAGDLSDDGATIALAWDRVAIPFHVAVDAKSITLASLRNELRHLPGYKGEAFFDAALYCVDHQFNHAEALQWIDRAIQMDGEQFDNLDLKSQILEGLGRHQEAVDLEAKALGLATPQQMYGYGDRLLREKKLADARAVFTRMTADHPDVFLNWYGLARVQVAEGDRAGAKATLERALPNVRQAGQKATIQRLLDRLAAGQGIG